MNSIDNLLKFGEASAGNPRTFWAVRQLYEFHRFGIINAKGLYFCLREFMPDEHTPVSRELTAPPGAAIVASKSIFSIEFIELSAFFAVALAIFGLRAEASPNFRRSSIEFIELSHFFAQVILFS